MSSSGKLKHRTIQAAKRRLYMYQWGTVGNIVSCEPEAYTVHETSRSTVRTLGVRYMEDRKHITRLLRLVEQMVL